MGWPTLESLQWKLLDAIPPIIEVGRFRNELQVRNHLPETDVALMPEH